MIKDGKIWLANDDKGENIFILPKMANRHGLVAGATGTGKTVTLKVMAESFSDMGVPVFMADVKGDVAGIMAPGEDSENMRERIERFGLAEAGFSYQGYPVNVWDLFGKTGIPLRTTISEVGPMLLSRILDLNDLQTDVMNVIFRIADDHNLLLVDTKDLKGNVQLCERAFRRTCAGVRKDPVIHPWRHDKGCGSGGDGGSRRFFCGTCTKYNRLADFGGRR